MFLMTDSRHYTPHETQRIFLPPFLPRKQSQRTACRSQYNQAERTHNRDCFHNRYLRFKHLNGLGAIVIGAGIRAGIACGQHHYLQGARICDGDTSAVCKRDTVFSPRIGRTAGNGTRYAQAQIAIDLVIATQWFRAAFRILDTFFFTFDGFSLDRWFAFYRRSPSPSMGGSPSPSIGGSPSPWTGGSPSPSMNPS